MWAQDQVIMSVQMDSAEPCEGFILTKVSKAGVRYFFVGRHTEVSTQSGEETYVAETSLFKGDARFFETIQSANSYAKGLNVCGIGGAVWKPVPYIRMAGGRGRGR